RSASPARIEASSPADRTLLANTPTWSSVRENSSAPSVLIRAKVGLNPTTPQNAAGRMTDPFVCEPIAACTTRAETAAADPIEEPPGVRDWSHGFRVGPGVRYASSAVTVLPSTMAPALSAARTAAALR